MFLLVNNLFCNAALGVSMGSSGPLKKVKGFLSKAGPTFRSLGEVGKHVRFKI